MGRGRLAGALVPLGLACVVVACTADTSESEERARRQRTLETHKAYESELAWLDRIYGDCQIQLAERGRCEIPASEETGMQALTIKGPTLETLDLGDRLR